MRKSLRELQAYLVKLGMAPEVGTLYLALCQFGPQTISGLMRHSGIERTRIYRMRKTIETCGLFEITKESKREIFSAAPFSNVQLLLSQKHEELQTLQRDFGQLSDFIATNHPRPSGTFIQFYSGIDGLKQMFWDETRAKSEMLCVLRHNMQSHTGATYFERWVRKCNESNLRCRAIVGETFQKDQRNWYSVRQNERLIHWQQREVPSQVFPILHSTVVYDETVLHYNWDESEIYGIKINNIEMASTQRSVFELLWRQSVVDPEH